jgi:hypothetical protein
MENFGLRKDCSRCFRARYAGAITDTPDVVILVVTHGLLVAIEVASCIGETGFGDELMRTHGRDNMQEIELASD